MKQQISILLSCTFIALLTACSGGGGDDDPATVAPIGDLSGVWAMSTSSSSSQQVVVNQILITLP